MKIFPYLNFDGQAKEAFIFYQSIFGGEFEGGINYFKDIQGMEIPEDEQGRVMHVSLRINPHYKIMASDNMPSLGHKLIIGNNNYVSIDADTKEQGHEFFERLSEDGVVEMEYQKTFWGAYFASFKDKFGVGWMINYDLKEGES